MFILEESGLALDQSKYNDGTFVPLPICMGCSRGKRQSDLTITGEGEKRYYVCAPCSESGKRLKRGQEVPAVLLRPWDSPEHLAFRRDRSAALSKKKAAQEAAADVKKKSSRGQGYEQLLQARLSAFDALIELGPEDEAEGIVDFVLVGWQGFQTRKGKSVVPLDFSRDRAVQYLIHPTSSDFREVVVSEAKKRQHFEAMTSGADLKN